MPSGGQSEACPRILAAETGGGHGAERLCPPYESFALGEPRTMINAAAATSSAMQT